MADTAALVVALSAQLTKFEKDMKQATDIADRSVSEIEDKFVKLNIKVPGIEELVSGFKKLASVAGIGLLIKEIHDLTDEVAKLADTAERVGITTEELQKLRYAIVSTGGSVEIADRFLDQFANRMAEAAKGTGELYNFLRVNNIAASEFVKLPLVEQIGKYADLVKNTGNQQQRLNEAFLVGGRQAGPQLVALLQQGGEAIKGLGEEAAKAGVIINDDIIARAKELHKEFELLKLQTGAAGSVIAVETWELLKNVINGVGDAIKFVIDNIQTLSNLKKFLLGEDTLHVNVPSPVRDTGGDDTTRQFNEQDDAFKKLIQSQEKRIQLLGAERDAIGLTVGAAAAMKTQIELENQAKEKNIPLTTDRIAKITEEAQKTGQAAQRLDDYQKAWRGLNDALQFGGDQMINILEGISNKTLTATQAMNNLTKAIVHALLQAVLLGSGPLGNILGFASKAAGGTGGLIGSLFSTGGSSAAALSGSGNAGWTAPLSAGTFLQHGGGVRRGGAYIVGEGGPELFVPSSGGQIVPGQLTRGGGGGTSVEINNFVAADTETKQTQQQGPDGERIIIDIVRKAQARGDLDAGNRSRFGLRAAKVR
jgi:hypothetical protein